MIPFQVVEEEIEGVGLLVVLEICWLHRASPFFAQIVTTV
jgi:hypothetical protein